MKRSLTKKERLRKQSEIKSLFSSGTSLSCKGLKMWHMHNDLGLTRVLLSPSRKCKNAVERNHNKRHGREVFRHLKEYVKPGFDIVFVFFPGDYSYHERYEQILGLLKKALLCHLPALP